MERGDPKQALGDFLRCLGDLMLLNWLWFFTSLPLLTIGPASAALYAVTLKLARGEPVHTVGDFFRAFRGCFRQGFVLGLIAIALLIIAVVDALFAMAQTGLFRTLFIVVALIVGALCMTFTVYAFALEAMFDNPLRAHILNAFALSFISPGRTLQMWLITLFPVAAALLLPAVAVRMLGFMYLIMGASGPAYLNSRILRSVFDKVNAEKERS